MLYVGIIEDHNKHRRMYVSSISGTDNTDKFDSNTVYLDFTKRIAKCGDTVAQNVELNTLRNILVAGGAHVTVE